MACMLAYSDATYHYEKALEYSSATNSKQRQQEAAAIARRIQVIKDLQLHVKHPFHQLDQGTHAQLSAAMVVKLGNLLLPIPNYGEAAELESMVKFHQLNVDTAVAQVGAASSSKSIKVKWCKERGFGLFATKSQSGNSDTCIKQGTVITEETALVSAPSLYYQMQEHDKATSTFTCCYCLQQFEIQQLKVHHCENCSITNDENSLTYHYALYCSEKCKQSDKFIHDQLCPYQQHLTEVYEMCTSNRSHSESSLFHLMVIKIMAYELACQQQQQQKDQHSINAIRYKCLPVPIPNVTTQGNVVINTYFNMWSLITSILFKEEQQLEDKISVDINKPRPFSLHWYINQMEMLTANTFSVKKQDHRFVLLTSVASLCNHDCTNYNCRIEIDGNKVYIRALRDIGEDEELLISYVPPPSASNYEHHVQKLYQYGIQCNCNKQQTSTTQAE